MTEERPPGRRSEPAVATFTATGELGTRDDGDASVGGLVRRLAYALLETDLESARFHIVSDADAWTSVEIAAAAGKVTATWQAVEPPFGLTPRELDVLTLVAGGLSNVDIGVRLDLSPRTAGTHVERILAKLGQLSRAGAAAVAVDRGLLRLPVPGGGRTLETLAVGAIDRVARGEPADRAARAARAYARAPARRAPFVIGCAFPAGTYLGGDGNEMANGSALAVSEINARGGIEGRMVRQVISRFDPFSEQSVEAAYDDLRNAEVDAILGGYAMVYDPGVEMAAEYGAPFLYSANANALIAKVREEPARYDRIFHVSPGDHYGAGFIRFLQQLRMSGSWTPRNRRLVVVDTDACYGQPCGAETYDLAERAGWRIEGVFHVHPTASDWEPVLARLADLEPAAVLVAQFEPTEAARFQRLFAARRIGTLCFMTYSPSIPAFQQIAGRSADGVLWSPECGVYSDSIGRSFLQRYERAFGVPPGRSHAGVSYDQVNLLGQAWSRAVSPRSHRHVARELRTSPHRGVVGAYYLDNPGQCALAYPDVTPDPSLGQANLVFQIQDGIQRIVSPAPYAEAPFRLPRWCLPDPVAPIDPPVIPPRPRRSPQAARPTHRRSP